MPSRVCPKCQQTVESEEPFCPRDGTRLITRSVYEEISTQTDPLVGQRIANRYLVIKKLGEGGMGDVFLGEHEDIEKRLALKVLKHEYSARPDVVARFKQEAVSASRIKHPNVLDVFDFGQLDDGRFFLAMELLEGRDLADALATERVLAPVRGLRIGLQVCRALAVAHSKGVIHRDMKPENVFLVQTSDGEELVKIVDFGIAQLRSLGEDEDRSGQRKLTKTGMIFGTPEYMAPEQAAGKKIDHRVDVYATGIIMFELFASRVPFYGETFMAVLTAHMTEPAPPIRSVNPNTPISPELERAIMRALEKKPDDRYKSMADFAEALLATPEAAAEGALPLTRLAQTSGVQRASIDLEPNAPRGQTDARATARTALETQLEVDPDQKPTKNSSIVVLSGISLALAAIGVIAGVFIMRSQNDSGGRGSTLVGSTTISALPVQIDSVKVPPVASTAASPLEASSTIVLGPSAEKIQIHVETKPDGAVVKKKEGESLLQVCASSPCDYLAQLDEKIEFVAEKGNLRGSGGVLARTPQTLTIQLKQSSTSTPATTNGAKSIGDCQFECPGPDGDYVIVFRRCSDPPARCRRR